MSTALVFPGQGSQYVGMGFAFSEYNERSNAVFAAAREACGRELLDAMFLGPEETLKKTDFTQPAILTVSVAIYEAIKDSVKPAFFAGHSLGEYSALCCAGAMDFKTAVEMVKLRGSLMQEASGKSASGMAAVLGLDVENIRLLCEKVKPAGYMSLANINCPGQIVVSGDSAAIDAGEAAAKELGAKRFIKLPVAGAFHSQFMQSAADGMAQNMSVFKMKDTAVPVISNVTAEAVTSAEEIKKLLVRQIVSPVRWIESVEYMKAQGVDTFIECGPGAVLSGLIKKIDKNLKVINIEKPEDLAKLQEI